MDVESPDLFLLFEQPIFVVGQGAEKKYDQENHTSLWCGHLGRVALNESLLAGWTMILTEVSIKRSVTQMLSRTCRVLGLVSARLGLLSLNDGKWISSTLQWTTEIGPQKKESLLQSLGDI